MTPVVIGGATPPVLGITMDGWTVERVGEDVIAVRHSAIGSVDLMREPRSHCEMIFRHFAESFLTGVVTERKEGE